MTNYWDQTFEDPTPVDLKDLPWMTWLLLLSMVIMFVIQSAEMGDPQGNKAGPSAASYIAMGGAAPNMIAEGQYFRLLSAAFLHANFKHLFFNCIALYLTSALELIVGRGWFLAIFLLTAMCGFMLSMSSTLAPTVAIGASGGILGLFAVQAAIGYISYDEDSPTQKRLTNRAWCVLIPTLAELTRDGADFLGHLGGALSGAIIGIAIACVWKPEEKRPFLPWLPRAINVVAIGYLLYGWHFLYVLSHH